MNIFKNKLKVQGFYVVKTGERQGGFLAWIQKYDSFDCFAFLFMPNPMESLLLTKQEVKDALKNKTFEFISILPDNVYEVCCANWKYYAEKQGLTYEHK